MSPRKAAKLQLTSLPTACLCFVLDRCCCCCCCQVPNRKLPATPPNATVNTTGPILYAGFAPNRTTYNCSQGSTAQLCTGLTPQSFCPVDTSTSSNPESPCAAVAVGDRGERPLRV